MSVGDLVACFLHPDCAAARARLTFYANNAHSQKGRNINRRLNICINIYPSELFQILQIYRLVYSSHANDHSVELY